MTDYALHGALQTTQGIRRKVLAYDIGCQYSVNLGDRYKQQFPEVNTSELAVLIGKMHVSNHVDECQWRRSFNYTPAVGRMDGEVAERWWSEANQVAGSTKHMNPGHRDDTLDDVINDWNRRKMQGAGEHRAHIRPYPSYTWLTPFSKEHRSRYTEGSGFSRETLFRV